MSDQNSLNQAVPVFHFTSNVSTANLRNHKLATAKGMRSSRSVAKAPTPALPSAKTTRSNSSTSQEPPAKKPRLKLNLRKPSSNDGDTIAVSRPKRASAGRSRYSEDVVVSDDEVEEIKEVQQSPAASSGLSSPISAPASVKDEVVATDAKVGGRDSYGDFLSYYVDDGDDAEEEPAPKRKRESKKEKPEKQQRKPRAKKVPTPPLFQPVEGRPQKASQPSRPSQPPQSPQSRPSSRHNHLLNNVPAPRPVAMQPQAHPTARPLPASRHPPVQTPMPPPRPMFEPPVIEEITVKYHASVPEKVKKLQALSTALTNFGGVPGTAKPAVPEGIKKVETKKPKKPGTCLTCPRYNDPLLTLLQKLRWTTSWPCLMMMMTATTKTSLSLSPSPNPSPNQNQNQKLKHHAISNTQANLMDHSLTAYNSS